MSSARRKAGSGSSGFAAASTGSPAGVEMGSGGGSHSAAYGGASSSTSSASPRQSKPQTSARDSSAVSGPSLNSTNKIYDPLQLFRTAGTFRECVRQSLLDRAILGVGDASAWRVMVLDEHATRIVSSIVGMYDIMEAHITCVENLSLSRQPFPEMEAIYVISPKLESIKRICADFANEREVLYKEAHVLLLGVAGEECMSALRSTPSLLKRLKTFKELNLDFLVAEVQAFHLDLGQNAEGNARLYRQLYLDRGDGASRALVNDMASCLTSLCSCIREYPHVRYSVDSSRAKLLAEMFQQHMNSFVAGAGADWSFNGQDPAASRDRATLLILDRSDDPLTPLMHEFTYQCLAEDVLTIKEGCISYESETKGGKSVTKEALLNDADDLWLELRHSHIAQVTRELPERFQALVRNHKGAAQLLGGGGRELSIQEMSAATRALPDFQELSKKLSMHIYMAGKCMDCVGKQDLLDVGTLEQTMAAQGVDELGKQRSRSDILQGWTVDKEHKPGLLELVSSPNVSTELKLRLLCVFMATQKGMTPEERSMLVGAAQLTPQEVAIVDALQRLGVHTGSPETEAKTSGKTSRFLKKFGISSKKSSSGADDDESEFSHMRYTPAIKMTLERLIRGQSELSLEEFPSLLPLPVEGAGATVGTSSVSRSARHGRQKTADGGALGKKASFVGSRIIVFVIGGVSYSELRAAYELMLATGREIVIGGSSILGGKEYLGGLEGLAK